MLPTSSCGTRMSPAAFGHVGFTGTSLWIDPVREPLLRAADQSRLRRRLGRRACATCAARFHDALADLS
jgi:hypothetical protein